eukprot:761222-Hanusia_phi.AAC.1
MTAASGCWNCTAALARWRNFPLSSRRFVPHDVSARSEVWSETKNFDHSAYDGRGDQTSCEIKLLVSLDMFLTFVSDLFRRYVERDGPPQCRCRHQLRCSGAASSSSLLSSSLPPPLLCFSFPMCLCLSFFAPLTQRFFPSSSSSSSSSSFLSPLHTFVAPAL